MVITTVVYEYFMALVSEGLLVLSIILIVLGVFLIVGPVPYPVVYFGWLCFIAGVICFAYWIYKQAKAS
jgi:hypothetical protein